MLLNTIHTSRCSGPSLSHSVAGTLVFALHGHVIPLTAKSASDGCRTSHGRHVSGITGEADDFNMSIILRVPGHVQASIGGEPTNIVPPSVHLFVCTFQTL